MVALRYGFPGRNKPVQTFSINCEQARAGSLLRRLWAQKKLEEVDGIPDRNQKEIAALGRDFVLVTPATSLMVLESLEQYVQYKIEPPKSLQKCMTTICDVSAK